MTLPVSGAISLGNINIELGVGSGVIRSLGDSNVRTLAGISSGAISLGNFYGKSFYNGIGFVIYSSTPLSFYSTNTNYLTVRDHSVSYGAMCVDISTKQFLPKRIISTNALAFISGLPSLITASSNEFSSTSFITGASSNIPFPNNLISGATPYRVVEVLPNGDLLRYVITSLTVNIYKGANNYNAQTRLVISRTGVYNWQKVVNCQYGMTMDGLFYLLGTPVMVCGQNSEYAQIKVALDSANPLAYNTEDFLIDLLTGNIISPNYLNWVYPIRALDSTTATTLTTAKEATQLITKEWIKFNISDGIATKSTYFSRNSSYGDSGNLSIGQQGKYNIISSAHQTTIYPLGNGFDLYIVNNITDTLVRQIRVLPTLSSVYITFGFSVTNKGTFLSLNINNSVNQVITSILLYNPSTDLSVSLPAAGTYTYNGYSFTITNLTDGQLLPGTLTNVPTTSTWYTYTDDTTPLTGTFVDTSTSLSTPSGVTIQ